MKTLVIHPKDPTTDFLIPIYEGRGWTVINQMKSKSDLKQQIKNHDRIIMLGHGTDRGLLSIEREEKQVVDFVYYIDATMVYLLREKECVCIWCNADNFVERYELQGFYTGMIISEYEEAMMYAIPHNSRDIEESNSLFTQAIKDSISKDDMLSEATRIYQSESNPIILFNRENLYERITK